MNYRKAILPALIPYFKKDDRLFLLYGDAGFGGIDELKKAFPDRICNVGIMEQGMVGIAAGMAMSGMIPVVFSFCNFLAFRALEQIRNDIVLQNQNVKLIGTGAEDYFSFLGPSHTCGEKDLEIMHLVGMNIYNPYDNKSKYFKDYVETFMKSGKAGYLRV